MSRKKTPTKVKEPIHVRTKKLANGNQSIYLDTYWNHKRSYEFLKGYFLIPETDTAAAMLNAKTMQAVNAIKAKRITALMDGTAGLKEKEDKDLLLKDWMEFYAAEKAKLGRSERNCKSILCAARHLSNMMGERAYKAMKLVDVDTEFCEDFINYLSTAPANLGVVFKKHDGTYSKPKAKTLAKSTASLYFVQFAAALRYAERKGKIVKAPTANVDRAYKKLIEPDDPDVAFLDIDELKRMEETPMRQEQVKHAFLFACYCGLRISDVEALRWGNLKDGNINVRMKKTDEKISVPIGANARKWLPKRNGKKDSELVFALPCRTCIGKDLERWAKRAGITKHVTPHVSRHTFATALISEGADLYTVSKLLGHHELKTTEIYAKLVDEKKRNAVSLLDNI